jgi:hypothetical protein
MALNPKILGFLMVGSILLAAFLKVLKGNNMFSGSLFFLGLSFFGILLFRLFKAQWK